MFLTSITSLVVTVVCLAALSDAQKAKCGVGEFFNGNKCELCSPGTYQNKKNATGCKPCPAGTYNPYHGAQGLDICIDCPAGTFGDKPGATAKKDCKKCPAGQNAPVGSPECIFCPAGKIISNCVQVQPLDDFASSFRGNCLSCNAGSSGSSCFLVGPINKLQCEDCFAGSFSNKPNSLECEPCPGDSDSQPGASKCMPGSRCPAGSYSELSGCVKCTSFTYSDGKVGFCNDCPPGFIGNSRRGAVKCVPCPSGTFKGVFDDRCRPCKEGENTFATGATFCVTDKTPCPPNYFRTKTGACLTCTKRQRLDKKKKTCVECPKNTLSEGGLSAKCNPCPNRTVTREDLFETRCFCRPGWGFGDGTNSGTCKKCPPGMVNDGGIYCQECYEESFAPNSGMAECLGCPLGTSQPSRGQTKCLPNPTCRKGLIRSEEGVCIDPATNCPPNHKRLVQDEFAPALCNPLTCPAGTVLIRPYDYEFSEACGVCAQGTRYNAKSKKCLECGNRETSDGGVSQVCKKCPPGFSKLSVIDNTGGTCRCVGGHTLVDGECVPCPKGTFGYTFEEGCEPCSSGTFSGRGVEFCENCPAGTFSGPGASSCKPCPKGTVSFGVGDSGCVRPGSLSD